jgi:hypothetical protein
MWPQQQRSKNTRDGLAVIPNQGLEAVSHLSRVMVSSLAPIVNWMTVRFDRGALLYCARV